MTILDQITSNTRLEVLQAKKNEPVEKLKNSEGFGRIVYSARESLQDFGIIAEFKRKSPSKGYFNQSADVRQITYDYAKSGAAVLSVLTDMNYFGGSLEDLKAARETVSIPILRKDFIVDPYQIFQSKAYGADLILLIASALEPAQVQEFSAIAKEIGLEVLLEVHSLQELESHLDSNVDLLGVNNRNLKTFTTDINLSKQLYPHIPDKYVAVSESGISSPEVLNELKEIGYKGFLIGETFMKQSDPGFACKDFIEALK